MKNFLGALTLASAFALVLFSSMAYAGVLDATRITLRNGMRVVLAPDPYASAVDATLWFPAGSRYEKPVPGGLAVLAARLGFRNGQADPLALLAAEGGTGDLAVTPDLASFSTTMPREALDVAFGFLAERAPGTPAAAADITAERGVLRAERARNERTPVARGLARLWAAAWPGHPYGLTGALPPAGTDAVTAAEVAAWRRARFSPATAVLTVTGDFDPDSALTDIRRRFEGAARGTAPPGVPLAAPGPVTRATERIDLPAQVCLMGWRGPGAGDPDAAALELLAALLGGGPQAQLVDALVNKSHLALAAQAGYSAQRDGSLLWTLAVVPPGADSSVVERTLLDVATAVAKTAPEGFEVERARRQLESGVWFGLQTARQRAQALGAAELLTGDAGAAARRITALDKVTPHDLQRVAARVMGTAGHATVWVLPSSTEAAR